MASEFKIRKSVQRGTGIVCAILILLLLFWGIKIWVWPGETFAGPIATTFFIVCCIFLLVLYWISMYKNRLLIEHDRIVKKGVFREKTMFFTDIKGFTPLNNTLELEPDSESGPSILITDEYEHFYALELWVKQRFKYLPKPKAENEKKSEADEEIPEPVHEKTIVRVKAFVKALNTLTWIVLGFIIIGELSFNLMVPACAILPVMTLIVFRFSRGQAVLGEDDVKGRFSLFFPIFFPTILLCLFALGSQNIIDEYKVWLTYGVLSIFFYALFYLIRYYKVGFQKNSNKIAMLFFALTYAYGFTFSTNRLFDTSVPVAYKVKILNKRASGGKHVSYYIQPERWGTQGVSEEAQVNKAVYEALAIGDSATIYLYRGFYHIRHYVLVQ